MERTICISLSIIEVAWNTASFCIIIDIRIDMPAARSDL